VFIFRHPKPVVDGRAVAVQVVQQKQAAKPQSLVLVAAAPAEPATHPAPAVALSAIDTAGQ